MGEIKRNRRLSTIPGHGGRRTAITALFGVTCGGGCGAHQFDALETTPVLTGERPQSAGSKSPQDRIKRSPKTAPGREPAKEQRILTPDEERERMREIFREMLKNMSPRERCFDTGECRMAIMNDHSRINMIWKLRELLRARMTKAGV